MKKLFIAGPLLGLMVAPAFGQEYSVPEPIYPEPGPAGAYTTMPLGPDGWTATTGPGGYYSETIPLGGGAYQTYVQPTPWAPAYPGDGQ